MSSLNSGSVDQSNESVGSYSFILDQKPCKGNSPTPDFVSDVKWWLNHHGLEKGCSLDQLNVLETDAQKMAATYDNGNAKAPATNKLIEDYCNIDPKNIAAFCSDIPFKNFCSHRKSNGDSWLLEFGSTINDDLLSDAHLMGLDPCNCLLFEQPEKMCSDLDSHWIGVEKIEPWWHAVDKEDLVSLVSQTSSHHIRKCNHPGFQSMHGEKVSGNCLFCFDQEQITGKETKVSHEADCSQGNVASVCKDKSLGKQGLMESILQGSDQSFSCEDSSNTEKVDPAESGEPSGDLSRDQLLEALCHSQTRARNAEKLAQKACDEKDHVINIFFQQASRLFAYRQWLRILQLETLCLQLSSKDQLPSIHTPSWVRNEGATSRKNGYKAAKKKLGKQKCNVSKYAIALAVGLGLAGAGLLVGWTVGWLFPSL